MPQTQAERGQIRTLTYVAVGVIFGLVFPIFASFTELLRNDMAVTPASISEQWMTLPILLRFAAPVFLGLIAFLFARMASSQLETERRYSQALLKHSNEVEARNQRLREMNEMLDGLVYTASHDLKTPVVNFKSMIQMARVVKDHPQNELLDQVLSRMDEAADKFQVTIEDLLDVSRIEKNFKGEMEVVNIEEMVNRCLEGLDELAKEKNAAIRVDTSGAPELRFPPQSLQNLLHNVISNALNYSREAVRPEIVLRTWSEEGKTFLSIRDNGVGIDLGRHEDKLFRMFSRLQAEHKGTGTGLYIVKRIMDLAEGDIRVESQIGQGSTFTFTFPKSYSV